MRTLLAPLLLLLVGLLALPPALVRAQSDDAVAEARVHFERGLELFNEGRHDAALAEFTRAHQIAPAPAVLYNIARVHEALGHAVEAADTYATYLDQAGEGMGGRRRREVEAALERQRARIAHLSVSTNVDGATISLDGVDVATTPLREPIRLAAGEHTLEVRGAGHESARRAVQLAGGDRRTVAITLNPVVSAQGTLRIVAQVPDVEVRLDDRVLGTTPLNATIPTSAGTHTVVGTRAGYREQRLTVEVAGGAEHVVELTMEPDDEAPGSAMGELRIHLPEAPSIVRVNGEPVIPREGMLVLSLPSGRHRIEVEVAEREPHTGDIEVPAGDVLDLTPSLQWTPEARAQRVSAASTTRTWAQVLTFSGAAVLLAGVGVVGWNEGRIGDTDARIEEINDQLLANGCEGGGPPICDELLDEGELLIAEQEDEERARYISWSVLGAGAVLTAIGAVLWATTPSGASIDESAHAGARSLRLRVGPGGLRLDGTF